MILFLFIVPPQSPTTPISKRTCNAVFDFSPQPSEASGIIRMDKENAQNYENAKQAIVGGKCVRENIKVGLIPLQSLAVLKV